MSDIVGLLDQYICISFDIFDTAILRGTLKPVDVFKLVAQKAAHVLNGLSPDSFQSLRIQAEKQARRLAREQESRREVNLDEIYHQLAQILPIPESNLAALKEIEITTELSITTANPYIHNIYELCLQAGKRVVFISDMYLPESVIRQMLIRNGYTQFDGLFVSSTYMLTKAETTLYRQALETLGLSVQDVLHIGDNKNTDVEKANSIGIHGVYYQKCLGVATDSKDERISDLLSQDYTEADSIIAAPVINRFYSDRPASSISSDNFWYYFGYAYIGPIYYGFTEWLLRETRKAQIHHLYFLSRDGYILEKVFDRFIEGQTGITYSYLYASRRAFNFPLIVKLDNDAVNFLMVGAKGFTVADYLTRINLNPADYEEQIKESGFSASSQFLETPADHSQLRSLLQRIQNVIVEKAAVERGLLMRYLEQEGVFSNSHIGVVDIGWHGTLQLALADLFALNNHTSNMTGFYLGLLNSTNTAHLNKRGYILENNLPMHRMRFILESMVFFEFVLFAPHGSAVRYVEHDGRIVAELSQDPHDDYRYHAAMEMQQGGMDFVEYMLEHHGMISLPVDTIIRGLSRVLLHPTDLEASLIGDLQHVTSYGNVYKPFHLAKPSRTHYALHPKLLHTEYRKAFWKTGFFARSHVNLLYYLWLRTDWKLKYWRRTGSNKIYNIALRGTRAAKRPLTMYRRRR
jgi:HAD superfamily hydrolase (TIGR01549 family)